MASPHPCSHQNPSFPSLVGLIGKACFSPHAASCPEKAMAPRSSTCAWKIPWTEEPGGLRSMGSLRLGHDWETSLSLFTFMHCRRKWQPTPVFLPGESQGWGSLVTCRLWGHTVRHNWSDLAAAAAATSCYLRMARCWSHPILLDDWLRVSSLEKSV